MAEQEQAEVLEQDGLTEETQVNAEQPAVAETPESGEADEQAAANDGEDEPTEDKHKRPGGWQRKIQKLERELEVWRNEALKRQESEPEYESEPVQPHTGQRPNVLTWTGTAEEFQKAEDAWLQARDSRLESQITQKVAWDLKVRAASSEYPDFVEVVSSSQLPITPAMQQAIKSEANGAELTYILAKNPDEAARILRLPVTSAMRELGKLEARLAGQPATEKEAPPPTTRAPRPPSPVSRPSGAKELRDDMPYKDWVKMRDAEIKARS